MCVCILALVTRQQIASLLRRIILSSVACVALTCFSTLFRKRKILGKKFYENEMCGLIFYANVSKTFLILRRI
jgi:hypothetical protein